MHELKAAISIDADVNAVWAILTDLEGHAQWNPFIIEASGIVADGEKLRVVMRPEGSRPTTFRPTVTMVDAPETFEWLGTLGPRGIFDGRHRFDIEPIDGGTRFVQSEQFSGVLAPLIMRMIGNRTLRSFEAMNAALKERVEAANPATR